MEEEEGEGIIQAKNIKLPPCSIAGHVDIVCYICLNRECLREEGKCLLCVECEKQHKKHTKILYRDLIDDISKKMENISSKHADYKNEMIKKLEIWIN